MMDGIVDENIRSYIVTSRRHSIVQQNLYTFSSTKMKMAIMNFNIYILTYTYIYIHIRIFVKMRSPPHNCEALCTCEMVLSIVGYTTLFIQIRIAKYK